MRTRQDAHQDCFSSVAHYYHTDALFFTRFSNQYCLLSTPDMLLVKIYLTAMLFIHFIALAFGRNCCGLLNYCDSGSSCYEASPPEVTCPSGMSSFGTVHSTTPYTFLFPDCTDCCVSQSDVDARNNQNTLGKRVPPSFVIISF